MDPSYPVPFNPGYPPFPPPHLPPLLPPLPPPSSAFWTPANVQSRLKEIRETLNLATALQKELEMLIKMKGGVTHEVQDEGDVDMSLDRFSKFMKENQIEVEYQESMSLNGANSIMSKLRFLMEPFRIVTDNNTPWEEKSAVKRLTDKLEKYKRNKLWRKRKRKRVAEHIAREREQFDQLDKEADEWMAKEKAKVAAQFKVEKLKEIAKVKANEEKKRRQSELELVLMVEKLQELRNIRIEKLKKQGHFLPEEDDKFLERVRAAAEEEERQLRAAADTDAAKDAIAAAEESRKRISSALGMEEEDPNEIKDMPSQDQKNETTNERDGKDVQNEGSKKHETTGPSALSAYDSATQLPLEFYHYYHGSNTDMGTLVEVRRTWDAFLSLGGSRIPGLWVQPPAPADDVWASYLVQHKSSESVGANGSSSASWTASR